MQKAGFPELVRAAAVLRFSPLHLAVLCAACEQDEDSGEFRLPLDSLVAATGRTGEQVKQAVGELRDAGVLQVWGSKWYLSRSPLDWKAPESCVRGPGATPGEQMSPVQRVRCRKGFAAPMKEEKPGVLVPTVVPREPDLHNDEPDPGKHDLSEEDALEIYRMIGERFQDRNSWVVARQWWDRQRQFPATLWRVGVEQTLARSPGQCSVHAIEYQTRRVSRGGKLKLPQSKQTREGFLDGLG